MNFEVVLAIDLQTDGPKRQCLRVSTHGRDRRFVTSLYVSDLWQLS